jgi:hypothetical protein
MQYRIVESSKPKNKPRQFSFVPTQRSMTKARTPEMTESDGIGKAFTKRLVEDFGPFLGYPSLAQQG